MHVNSSTSVKKMIFLFFMSCALEIFYITVPWFFHYYLCYRDYITCVIRECPYIFLLLFAWMSHLTFFQIFMLDLPFPKNCHSYFLCTACVIILVWEFCSHYCVSNLPLYPMKRSCNWSNWIGVAQLASLEPKNNFP